MKKLFIFLFLLVFSSIDMFANVINDLVVFSNEGEKFILILNGEKYNEIPAVRVTARGLTLPTYKVKIIFEDKKLDDHNTTLYFYATGKECLFVLAKKGKKKHSMDYVSEKDLFPTAPVTTNNNTTDTNTGTNTNTNISTNNDSYTYTSTPGNTTAPINSDNNSLNIKAGNLNIGLNDNGSIKIGSKEGNVNMNTGDKSGNLSIGTGDNAINLHKKAVQPKTGCASPMSSTDFATLKASISSQNSDDSKLIAANALIDKNCFTTDQVKEIMKLLPTDEARLEFAKKVYPNTSDLSNYHQLKDTFTDEGKKKEFTAFIKDQK